MVEGFAGDITVAQGTLSWGLLLCPHIVAPQSGTHLSTLGHPTFKLLDWQELQLVKGAHPAPWQQRVSNASLPIITPPHEPWCSLSFLLMLLYLQGNKIKRDCKDILKNLSKMDAETLE